jgi:outer membrane lipoprotein SlyB
MAIGGVAGALLGGLAGAAVGCMAGEESGEVFDGRVFHTHSCEECGHSFTL